MAIEVVIVEGVEPVRQRLAALAREAGAHVAGEAAGIPKGFALVEREHPDLAVIGSRLEDGSGFELLRALGPERRPPRVILLCEQLDAAYLFTARGLGVDFLLEIPRDLDLLPRLLRYVTTDRCVAWPRLHRA